MAVCWRGSWVEGETGNWRKGKEEGKETGEEIWKQQGPPFVRELWYKTDSHISNAISPS